MAQRIFGVFDVQVPRSSVEGGELMAAEFSALCAMASADIKADGCASELDALAQATAG